MEVSQENLYLDKTDILLIFSVWSGLSIEAGSRQKSAGYQTALRRLALPGHQLKRNALKSCSPFPDLLHVGELLVNIFHYILPQFLLDNMPLIAGNCI